MFGRRKPMSGPEWREEARRQCVQLLDPGEEPRHLFVARVGEPPNNFGRVFWFGWFAVVGQGEHRMFCVTDRAIVIMWIGRRRLPEGVMARMPRGVQLGPLDVRFGEWAGLMGLGGGLFVHRAHHGAIVAADAELGLAHDWDVRG